MKMSLRSLSAVATTVVVLCSYVSDVVVDVAAQATYPSEFSMEYCLGDKCYKTRLSCPQLQQRMWAFYTGDQEKSERARHFVNRFGGGNTGWTPAG